MKEFLPRSLRDDVLKEAQILSSLCHPYLPCFLGVNLKDRPLRIVMKFHAEDNNIMSRTLFLELHEGKLKSEEHAFRFCTQVIEAVCYHHNEVEILHNDITVRNIVIDGDHIVLVDFGKATRFSQARMYRLTEAEKQEYTRKYPHLAPELI